MFPTRRWSHRVPALLLVAALLVSACAQQPAAPTQPAATQPAKAAATQPAKTEAKPAATQPAQESKPQAAAQRKRKMIFVTHAMDPFFIPTIIGMRDACGLAGWECNFIGPRVFSAEETVKSVLDAIQQKPDAIAFTYTVPQAFEEPVKQGQNAGIFMISYNTDSPGRKELGLAYVGQDQVPAGRISGYEAAKHAQAVTGKTSGKIVIVTCCPGHTALEQRIEGTKQGVEQYNQEKGTKFTTEVLTAASNDTDYVSKVEAKWTADQANIVGFAGVDGLTRGLALFIESRNLKGKVAGGGFDYLDATLEGIKKGVLQWTIGQDPYSQGFLPVMLAWIYLERGYPARDYDTGAEVADASNIDFIIKREGLWKEKAKEAGF